MQIVGFIYWCEVLWPRELQILQFALDKNKETYEHKRMDSKLNSLFSYFMM